MAPNVFCKLTLPIKQKCLMKAYSLSAFFAACVITSLAGCKYDPDRVSDGDANPHIVEYRKIYSASSTIGPESTLDLLDTYLSNPEFKTYSQAWNLKAYMHYQMNEFDQSLKAANMAMSLTPESAEISTQYLMSKIAAGKSCEIEANEINDDVYGRQIAMWSHWLCHDSLPNKETVKSVYPVTEKDSSNLNYQRLCLQLIQADQMSIDESLFVSLKNGENLKSAVMDYMKSPNAASALLVYQALRR